MPKPLFGSLVRGYRERKNWTLAELAARLEALGYPIDPSTISKYELGQRFPVDGAFIAYFEVCLGLTFKDAKYLIEGLCAEHQIPILRTYNETRRRL